MAIDPVRERHIGWSVWQSKINRDIYVGFTTDLKNRFNLHNVGKVKSTKFNRPWTLIYYEAYKSKTDATIREKRLKMHGVKNDLLSRLGNSTIK
jgi:putative endonuclease